MEDLPDPETPVKTTNLFLGNSKETFLRLFSLAPLTMILSSTIFYYSRKVSVCLRVLNIAFDLIYNQIMKITILGAGTFFVSAKKSGPSYLLEADGKKILIDCGPGTLLRLSELSLKPEDLDYIFISHFHADHTSDLFPLQMSFRINDFYAKGKKSKTPIIFGPEGIDEFTKKLSYIYELPAFDNYSKIKYKKYQESIQLGNLSVKTFKVNHVSFNVTAKAYALRFETDGKVVAFSGDSNKCKGLKDVCKKADLFICDTSYSKGNGNMAHLDSFEVGEIAQRSNVKKLVLTHIYPRAESADLEAEVREKYFGEIIKGEDFMEFEI